MKTTTMNHLLKLTGILFFGVCRLDADAASVTVTSNPLWTDTGITLTPADTVIVHDAAGSWNIGGGYPWCGPEGLYAPADWVWNEWITNQWHGQLIAFVGDVGVDPNHFPSTISQNDLRLFAIGTNSVTLTNMQGKLWLGFNDGWTGLGISDNAGSVVAQVDGPIFVTIQVSCVDVCWNSQTNRMYQVQYQSALTTNSWVNLGAPVPGSVGTTCVTDSVRNTEKRFYRVAQLP